MARIRYIYLFIMKMSPVFTVRKMLRPLANERGKLFEIPIMLALLCISISIGAGQYGKHGWLGVFLGTTGAFFGIIAAFITMIGILSGSVKINEIFRKHSWYLFVCIRIKWIFLLLFFSLWGVFLTLGVSFLFQFDLTGKGSKWLLYFISLAIGGMWVILCRHFGQTFWSRFWHFSGLLLIGSATVFIGMMVGQVFFANPSQLMLLLKILFFVPLLLYVMPKLIRKKTT
ncbi:hypothetical protein QUF70_10245 [Desulfobacterales bacterium HSG17]|nr:hypothetical protein [Desulfobacterales bacterium HSG17]